MGLVKKGQSPFFFAGKRNPLGPIYRAISRRRHARAHTHTWGRKETPARRRVCSFLLCQRLRSRRGLRFFFDERGGRCKKKCVCVEGGSRIARILANTCRRPMSGCFQTRLFCGFFVPTLVLSAACGQSVNSFYLDKPFLTLFASLWQERIFHRS